MSEEHSVDENEKSTGSFNRRSFVKALGGVGGAGITASAFSSSAQAAAPQQSPSKSREPISVDKLDQLARKVTEQEDIMNVMDATMQKTVQTGTVVEVSHSGPTSTGIVTRNSPQVAKENGMDDLAKDDIVVSGVRHTLENGNEMTALTYATDNEAILSRRFKETEGMVKQKASRWNINGETVKEARLELLQSSVNGEPTKSPSDFTTMSHCGGCGASWQPGYNHTSECQNYDVVCLASCSACGLGGCTPCTIACVTTYCAWLLSRCCQDDKASCFAC
jgi:hypothetical protein